MKSSPLIELLAEMASGADERLIDGFSVFSGHLLTCVILNLLILSFSNVVATQHLQARSAFCAAFCSSSNIDPLFHPGVIPRSSETVISPDSKPKRERRGVIPPMLGLPPIFPMSPMLPGSPRCPPSVPFPPWPSWGEPTVPPVPPTPSGLEAAIQDNVRRFWEMQNSLRRGAWPPWPQGPERPPCDPCTTNSPPPDSSVIPTPSPPSDLSEEGMPAPGGDDTSVSGVPRDNTPATIPPSIKNSVGSPAVVNPPVENPPAENVPVENLPAETPPVENPPVANPPAENTPAESPPDNVALVGNVPAENPAAVDAPVEDPVPENPSTENPLRSSPDLVSGVAVIAGATVATVSNTEGTTTAPLSTQEPS